VAAAHSATVAVRWQQQVAAARWLQRWRQRHIVTSAAAWWWRGGGGSAAARQRDVDESPTKGNKEAIALCGMVDRHFFPSWTSTLPIFFAEIVLVIFSLKLTFFRPCDRCQ
jgi:hypothetical protein